MSFVYGPVPSRRLGQSLGIDPIPSKSCNYNCVYCQLGRTRLLTNERKDFFPPECILAEVESSLTAHKPGDIDCVTFVGQGEPLLCRSLGVLIRRVKAVSDLPVAVITNGSLLWQPEVQQELQAADIVMPSLDCVDEATFRRINRPSPKLRIGEVIDGLAAFRAQFRGRLWVEVMLLRGVNDGEQALLSLRDTLAQLHPDQVHLNVPIRPPAESWVEPPDEEGLMRAVAILGEAATRGGPLRRKLRSLQESAAGRGHPRSDPAPSNEAGGGAADPERLAIQRGGDRAGGTRGRGSGAAGGVPRTRLLASHYGTTSGQPR